MLFIASITRKPSVIKAFQPKCTPGDLLKT